MNIPEHYRWEGETPGGRIITVGGDLRECIRFSLIPAPELHLPRHDLVGVPLTRRFGRGFVRGFGGGTFEYLHCAVCRGFRFYVLSTTGEVRVTPEDYELYL